MCLNLFRVSNIGILETVWNSERNAPMSAKLIDWLKCSQTNFIYAFVSTIYNAIYNIQYNIYTIRDSKHCWSKSGRVSNFKTWLSRLISRSERNAPKKLMKVNSMVPNLWDKLTECKRSSFWLCSYKYYESKSIARNAQKTGVNEIY